MAYNAGIPVWVGGMLESSIGRALCIELATLKNCVYPNDISPPTYTHKTDLGVPSVSYSKPFTFSAFANSLPEPNEEILLACSLRKKSIIAWVDHERVRGLVVLPLTWQMLSFCGQEY